VVLEEKEIWLGGLETNFRAKNSLKPWVPPKFRSLRFASEVPLGTFDLAYISGVRPKVNDFHLLAPR